MMWLQCLQPHHKVPSWNSDIQQPCQQLLSQSYENKQEIEAFHSEFETNVIVIRLTEDQEKAFHLFKLKKKKSDSKESKFGDKRQQYSKHSFASELVYFEGINELYHSYKM